MKDMEKCLDSQFWHACAGGMVQMPPVNSKVYYFPQGQAEHANSSVDFGSFPKIPAFVLCRVAAMKFLADHDTDEVYVKIRLEPIKNGESDFEEENGILHSVGSDIPEKPASFAKTLTQSDANNGGGFSVPRYCAEMIFPRLDYSADPPVQTVLAKDVHGEIWKFRHIYRGTPRRHLLTTGWSSFVNQKKLMAGDSIVFLRAESGDLCIGIRRAKRGMDGGSEIQSGWNSSAGNCMSPYGGSSIFLREEECKFTRARNSRNMNTNGGFQTKGKVRAESVLEAASLAANGQPFEVAYYPRASTPEFCVKASNVVAAMRIQWCSGMRFKMAFETEDSSRISWFMGTISSVQVTDPIRWPNSPWRLLQVTWDEPDLLQNVKRVSPWLVELVSTIPSILAPFSPPRKKLRPLPNTDLFLDDQVSLSNNPLGIQGARHHLFDTSLTDFQFNKLKSGLFLDGFHQFSPSIPPSQVPTNVIVGNSVVQDSVSCMPKTGNSPDCMNNSNAVKAPCFLLFGQPILTEEQISLSSSETVSTILMGNNSPNGNQDRTASSSSPEKSFDRIPRNMDLHAIEIGLETGHCKVFMESEDVPRKLDISVLGSYEELYRRLANMFGIERSALLSRILYQDANGIVKHAGDEPFSDFIKTTRRLTILMDSSSDNTGR